MIIIAIAAISADGCMTKHDQRGNDFTSSKDKVFFFEALKSFDCSVFGSGTFKDTKEHILRSLTPNRLRLVLTNESNSYLGYETPGALIFRQANPLEAITELKKNGCSRCALLGDKTVFSQFLAEGLIDELWVTLEPRIFGHGASMFEGAFDQRLSLISAKELGSSVLLLKYSILK